MAKQQHFRDVTLDTAEKCLVISYSTDPGDGGELTHHKKRIRLKAIDANTDVNALADAILASASIIPAAKKSHVAGLLAQLKPGGAPPPEAPAAAPAPAASAAPAPAKAAVASAASTSAASAAAAAPQPPQQQQRAPSAGRSERADSKEEEPAAAEEVPDWDDPTARMQDVDAYLEKLYDEDLATKTEGARKIVALAQHARNLEALCANGALMGALARVLRDEYKKSVELTTALVQVFLCASHWKELHAAIIAARAGDMCMRIVELEHARHAARMADLARLERLALLQGAGDAAGEAAFRKADAAERAREEAGEAAEASKAADRKKRGGAGAASGGEEEGSGGGSGGGSGSGGGGEAPAAPARKVKLRPLAPGKVEIDKERRKAHVQTRRSEGLMWACLLCLLHLAEDLEIERKMCKRGIVGLIMPLLAKGRDNVRLQLQAVNFLRKLSIFEENKNAMVALGAGPLLVALLPKEDEGGGGGKGRGSRARGGEAAGGAGALPPAAPPAPPPPAPPASPLLTDLRAAVLHLMFNLTFDPTMCASFLHCRTIPKAGAMLRHSPFRQPGLKLLYRLSTDYTVRGQFAATEAVGLTLSMVLKFPALRLPPELAALAANLTMHPLTAEAILQYGERGSTVKKLVARLVKTGDAAVAKVLRGLSQYTYSLAADAELRAAAEEETAAMSPELAEALGLVVASGKGEGRAGAKGRAAAAQAAVARAERAREAAGEGKVGEAAEEEALAAGSGGGGGSGSAAQQRRKGSAAKGSASVLGSSSRALRGGGGGSGSSSVTGGGSLSSLDEGGTTASDPSGLPPGGAEAFNPRVGSALRCPPSAAPVAFSTPHDGLWAPCVGDILHMLSLSEAQDVVDVSVELLGLLGNLLPRDLPGGTWAPHLSTAARSAEGGLLSTLLARLAPQESASEDDLLLEAVLVVSSMALDGSAAPAIAASPLPRALVDVIRARGMRDADICLQALVACNRLLVHEETREMLAVTTAAPGAVAVLMGHPHPGIAAEAADAAYLISEYDRTYGDGRLAEELKTRRYLVHNARWCAAMAKASQGARAHPKGDAPGAGGGGAGGGAGGAGGARAALASPTRPPAPPPPGEPAALPPPSPPPLPPAPANAPLLAALRAEAARAGQPGPHYWLPASLPASAPPAAPHPARYALVTVDDGEECERLGGSGGEEVDEGLEGAMLAACARWGGGGEGGGGGSGGGGAASPGRGEGGGIGEAGASRSPVAAMQPPREAVSFDVDYLWQQAQSVGNAYGEGSGGGGGGAGGGAPVLRAVRVRGSEGGSDAGDATGSVRNRPYDFCEEVGELGEHEDSEVMGGGAAWGEEGGGEGTDVEEELAAAAAMNPYGARGGR